MVQFNLENDHYKTIQAFLNDVQLIWDNCYTYNPPKNYISKCAQICEKKFKKEFEKYFNINIDIYEEYSHDNIGINEKMELKETINKLIKDNNIKALNNIKNYCIKIVPHIIHINDKEKTLDYLHLHKTSDLFQLAMRSGAIIANAEDEKISEVTEFARNFGLAFQIADDILDEISTFEQMGKTMGKDKDENKLTYVSLYGLEDAKCKLSCILAQCRDTMKKQNFNSVIFNEIIVQLYKRVGI
jgi:geranylgeranyl pyrophosphate synthase